VVVVVVEVVVGVVVSLAAPLLTRPPCPVCLLEFCPAVLRCAFALCLSAATTVAFVFLPFVFVSSVCVFGSAR
jgi:hypothetical protein